MKNKFFTEILFLLMMAGILLYMPGWALSAEMQKGLNRILAQNTIRLPPVRQSQPKPILRQPPSVVKPSVPVPKNPTGVFLFTPDLNGTWNDSRSNGKYEMFQWREKDQSYYKIRWEEPYQSFFDRWKGEGKAVGSKLTTQIWWTGTNSKKKTRTGVVEVFFNANWVVPTKANCKKNSWLRIRWDDGEHWLK